MSALHSVAAATMARCLDGSSEQPLTSCRASRHRCAAATTAAPTGTLHRLPSVISITSRALTVDRQIQPGEGREGERQAAHAVEGRPKTKCGRQGAASDRTKDPPAAETLPLYVSQMRHHRLGHAVLCSHLQSMKFRFLSAAGKGAALPEAHHAFGYPHDSAEVCAVLEQGRRDGCG